MSAHEPFDAETIITLWTRLLQFQVDIGYYENDDSISYPPAEGRAVDETLCQQLGLTDEVITLMKRLPCPSNFDAAYDTTILSDSMAVPFPDSEWIRNSRDPERCWFAGSDTPLRLDYMKPEDLTLVLAKDEPGCHLILDTKANTARFFVAMMQPYDSDEEDKFKPERPHDRMHYRNHLARPAVEVLEELVAKFRDLEWIPIRDDQGWPDILTVQHDEDEKRPNLYSNAKNILREQYGWPNNFDKENWNRQRTDIWKRLRTPVGS